MLRYLKRTKPSFRAIKKGKAFEWTERYKALAELKAYFKNPRLAKPIPTEQLLIYLSVSEHAFRAVLIKEDEGRQHPVYYISKTVLDAETQYSPLELTLALVTAARKLRHYFEVHLIKVVTSYPIKAVFSRPDLTRRLIKWAVKLSRFGLMYEPRTAIKPQVLADFMAEFLFDLQVEAKKEMAKASEHNAGEATSSLVIDGERNCRGSSVGVDLTDPRGTIFERAI